MKNIQNETVDICRILKEINDKINISNPYDCIQDVSLYSGLSGIALFQIYYQRQINGDKVAKEFCNKIIHSLISIFEENCDKYKGNDAIFQYSELSMFLMHLKQENLIDENQLSMIFDDKSDEYINEGIKFFLKTGFIDLFSGASGLGLYLLKRYETKISNNILMKYIDSFIDIANSTCLKIKSSKSVIYWKSFGVIDKSWGINIGPSHGIIGISLLLLKFHPIVDKDRQNQIYLLINGVIGFLETIRYKDNRTTCFPGYLELDFSEHPMSTLMAWCYGDIPIAEFYKKSSEIFPELRKYSKYADDILIKTCNRDISDERFLTDISLCHGAAGILMMYNSLVHDKNYIAM